MKQCEVNCGMQVSTRFWKAFNFKIYTKSSGQGESHRDLAGNSNVAEVYLSKIGMAVIDELSRIQQEGVRETNERTI